MIADSNRYAVQYRNIDQIKPSPENAEIYGDVVRDTQFANLVSSIDEHGLAEPLIVTLDGFILSGHRRYEALRSLRQAKVPVRVENVRRENNPHFVRLLTEFNPQRVKSAGILLREALLRAEPDDPLVLEHKQRASIEDIPVDFSAVGKSKRVPDVSPRKQDFLKACQRVVESLKDYWPLNLRQIHYNLLNAPPLKQVVKRSKHNAEKYLYRNDRSSYQALSQLMVSARYHGHIPMSAIDDPTRKTVHAPASASVSEFVHKQTEWFLKGYRLDIQRDQPRHIEVLVEKNTVLNIVSSVTKRYFVPCTPARGYGSIPAWRDIAYRFDRSRKRRMTLIVASDFDPEGLDLADEAVASLRDMWHIPVDYHRVAVKQEQVDELGLAADFNPAKPDSTRLSAFVDRTGDNRTWELEALPPAYLQKVVEEAINANMDQELLEASRREEGEHKREIAALREQLIDDLQI